MYPSICNKRFTKVWSSLVVAGVSGFLFLSISKSACAQVSTDVFDVSRGGSITASSSTISGFEPIGLIGGATTGENNAGNTIFTNVGTIAAPNFVNIKTAGLVTLNGVNLFTLRDATPSGTLSRSTSRFSLFADVDGNGSFETVLVNGVDPNDNGLANTYTFAAVTAQFFRAEFVGNTNVVYDGPRIVELDAIGSAVPEPGEVTTGMILVATIGLGLVRGRRRRVTAACL